MSDDGGSAWRSLCRSAAGSVEADSNLVSVVTSGFECLLVRPTGALQNSIGAQADRRTPHPLHLTLGEGAVSWGHRSVCQWLPASGLQ